MKFSLPEKFEVVVETASQDQSVHNYGHYPLRSVSLDPLKPRTIDYPGHVEADLIYDAINEYTHSLKEQKIAESTRQKSQSQQFIQSAQELSKINILKLGQEIEARLRLQDLQVQDVINNERKRVRLIEEARQRKLEEEARLKRLEEERLEREEEARKEKERERLEAEKRQKEAERLKLEQEQKAAQAAELKKKQEQDRLEEIKRLKETRFTNFNNVEKEFYKYKNDIEDIKQNVKLKIDQNTDLKRAVNRYKRKINPKFGQLSNSKHHTDTLIREVITLVEPVKADELAYKWILNFMAKAIVHQAETEVIVRPFAATPLAHLAYSLLVTFPEFEYFLAARFVKKCPYIIGFTDPMTTVEGRLRMNWKQYEDDQWESDVKYDERVAGICTVWAVMTQFLSGAGKEGLFSEKSSWQFVARILNTDLSLIRNTHFEVLANWWEATAAHFLQVYKRQAVKVLQLMVSQFVDAVADRKYPSAARLRILGEDWIKMNRIEPMKEMEP
ncbi:hypothetical protein KGF56_000012 [Candida oxycetoniae]|uniref:mRNA export factor GLE1 n=1 Tax=Candida oxycetoniae TaxID=497107 RepID=A0AAI9T1Y0_9ASCO|nr:uncharacterized protein KGF56_000012 [Candida oxycetoniae]KAI3407172.2 hypothetical protein KGF56_000012 [Candida oxycetoniae]